MPSVAPILLPLPMGPSAGPPSNGVVETFAFGSTVVAGCCGMVCGAVSGGAVWIFGRAAAACFGFGCSSRPPCGSPCTTDGL